MGQGERLTVEVLGPLRVRDAAGDDVTPEGPLQRRLLALLVLRRGHAVSVDRAIDSLWPQRPPRDPVAALHNHVSRLRQRLLDGLIESAGDGYRLDPARIDLDADRLLQLVQPEGGDPDDVDALDALLARWHGPAYPELEDVDDGQVEAGRLEELRVRAVESRAEHRLERGDTDGLVAELAALADTEPLRERPRQLLMSTLAATGRQVEALRVYDDFRRLLSDELGIEPSPILAALHAELLAGSPGAPTDQRALGSRLPMPAGSFVGRDGLLEELVAAVPAQRLLTLVGPGGMGKTRLALELGHRLRSARPERAVVVCELASATGEVALDVVTAALGIDGRLGVPPADRVVSVLLDTEAVLILDNCEHVLEPIAALAEQVLAGCPNVTVLATSRERLRVHAEQVWAIPALGCDPDDPAAVQLFLDRGAAACPTFDPTEDDLAVVRDVVRRLDGLPLAIELAAACLHTQDLAEIAAGLDHRFALLSSGFRTSERHGSLRAAVSWSFELLDPTLRDLFATLAVFSGPFGAADAAVVCDLDLARTTTALAELVERSLVARTPDRRYVLLETLRAFGLEVLRDRGRLPVAADRHAEHYAAWVDDADARLRDAGDPALAEIEDALPELRAAVDWALEHEQPTRAGRIVAALLHFGFFRLRPDVLAWSERVTAVDPSDASPFASRVWVVAAYAAWMGGDLPETIVRTERALRIADDAGTDPPSTAAMVRASCALWQGDLDDAAAWYRRSVELGRREAPGTYLVARASEVLALGYAHDPGADALALEVLAEMGEHDTLYAAFAWYCAGEALQDTDPTRARERYVRALEVAERTRSSFVVGLAGASKASIDARQGDPVEAAAEYRRLLLHWRRAGMWSTQWTMLRSIAGLLARLGRHDDAAVLEGAVRGTDAGHRIFGADEVALLELSAELRAALGDEAYDAARARGARLDGDAAVEHALHAL